MDPRATSRAQPPFPADCGLSSRDPVGPLLPHLFIFLNGVGNTAFCAKYPHFNTWDRGPPGTVRSLYSSCSSVSQMGLLLCYLMVRNQASEASSLKKVFCLCAKIFPVLFHSGNMGIICFDQYFHILDTTVIETSLRHQPGTRTLQDILKRRGESLYREISK